MNSLLEKHENYTNIFMVNAHVHFLKFIKKLKTQNNYEIHEIELSLL